MCPRENLRDVYATNCVQHIITLVVRRPQHEKKNINPDLDSLLFCYLLIRFSNCFRCRFYYKRRYSKHNKTSSILKPQFDIHLITWPFHKTGSSLKSQNRFSAEKRSLMIFTVSRKKTIEVSGRKFFKKKCTQLTRWNYCVGNVTVAGFGRDVMEGLTPKVCQCSFPNCFSPTKTKKVAKNLRTRDKFQKKFWTIFFQP